MKKTQKIELKKLIGEAKIPFISILLFVAMGVAVFTGFGWSGHALEESAEAAFERGRLHDLEALYAYGFDEKDIAEIASMEGVEAAEGTYMSYQSFELNGKSRQARLIMLTSLTDIATDVEGRLPTEPGEIAVETSWARKNGLSIGDAITFEHDDVSGSRLLSALLRGELNVHNMDLSDAESLQALTDQLDPTNDGMRFLTSDTYVITGFAETSVYISPFSVYYGVSATTGTPVDCLLFVPECAFDKNAYTGYTGISIRGKNIHNAVTAAEEYKKGADDLKETIEDRIYEIAEEKYKKIVAAADEALDALEETIEARDTFVAQEKETISSYLPGEEQTGLLLAALTGLVPDGEERLKSLKEEYAKLGMQLLPELETDLSNIHTVRKDIYEALLGTEENDSLLKKSSAVVMTREFNGGAGAVGVTSRMIEKLRWSMALLFVIVGLAVCISAVSRLVYKQMKMIGTKKALGFYRKEITEQYLAYSGIAGLSGSVLGLLIGYRAVEPAILKAVSGSFLFGKQVLYFSLTDTLIAVSIEIGLLLFATYFCCRKITSGRAVDLLAGPVPVAGKQRFYEKGVLWQKLPLLNKTIINNCMNDRKRVFGTVTGIAGCTALVVCALTFRNCVMKSFDVHFEDVAHYDTIVYFDTSVEEDVGNTLSEKGISSARILASSGIMLCPDGSRQISRLYVPENAEDFAKLFSTGGVEAAPGTVLISDSCKLTGAEVGDEVQYINAAGSQTGFTIGGFYKFYLSGCQIIADPVEYERLTGAAPIYNCYLVDATSAGGIDELTSILKEKTGVLSVTNFTDSAAVTYNTFSGISLAVTSIYILLSVLMALLVILNLLRMFVSEKKRELIVMMINGFSRKDAKKYIYSDTIFLALLGILIGTLAGSALGMLSVNSLESGAIRFFKQPDGFACLAGAALSAVFTFLMSVIALKEIDRFKLTDINAK